VWNTHENYWACVDLNEHVAIRLHWRHEERVWSELWMANHWWQSVTATVLLKAGTFAADWSPRYHDVKCFYICSMNDWGISVWSWCNNRAFICYEFDHPLNVAYLDIKAAFDSVDLNALWKAYWLTGCGYTWWNACDHFLRCCVYHSSIPAANRTCRLDVDKEVHLTKTYFLLLILERVYWWCISIFLWYTVPSIYDLVREYISSSIAMTTFLLQFTTMSSSSFVCSLVE